MGIGGVSEYIRSNCKKGRKIIPLSKFANKAIAIDAPGFFWRRWAVAHAKIVDETDDIDLLKPVDTEKVFQECFKIFVDFILKWMKFNITPVFIFDGEPRDEKSDTIETRISSHKKRKDKIEELIENLKAKDPNLIEERDYVELRKALRNDVKPKYKSLVFFKDFLDLLGLPWFQSVHDAEQLCAVLVIEGYAAASFTCDQDIYAFGSSFTIIQPVDEANMEYVDLEIVLEEIGLDYPQFVDACILSGCDFNKKIKGIAFKTALKIIKKFGRIENIPVDSNGNIDINKTKGLRLSKKFIYSISLVDAPQCRRIFRFLPSAALIKEGTFNLKLYNDSELQSLCAKNNITVSLPEIIKWRTNLAIPEVSPHKNFYII